MRISSSKPKAISSIDLSKLPGDLLKDYQTNIRALCKAIEQVKEDITSEMESRNFDEAQIKNLAGSEYVLDLSEKNFSTIVNDVQMLKDIYAMIEDRGPEGVITVDELLKLRKKHTKRYPLFHKVYKCPYCGKYELATLADAETSDRPEFYIFCKNCYYDSRFSGVSAPNNIDVWSKFQDRLVQEGILPAPVEI